MDNEQLAKVNKVDTIGADITITIKLPINLLESSSRAFDNYVRNFFEEFKSDFIDNAYKVRHRYQNRDFDS